MTLYRLPLQPVPQRFEIDFLGVTYVLSNRWNDEAAYWMLDWFDANGVPLVMGMPVVAGVNLLEPYASLPAGTLAVITEGDPNASPTLLSLGTDSNLYYLPP